MADWNPGTSLQWLKYRPTESGLGHLPRINVRLRHEGVEVERRPFILDSGAVQSVAPWWYAQGLVDLDQRPLRPSHMKDAHGRPLHGVPVSVDIELLFNYPDPPWRLQETLWFAKGIRHGLLGQSAAFEQLGVLFLNFPHAPEGRRFGLFKAPPSPGPTSGMK